MKVRINGIHIDFRGESKLSPLGSGIHLPIQWAGSCWAHRHYLQRMRPLSRFSVLLNEGLEALHAEGMERLRIHSFSCVERARIDENRHL